MAVADVTDRQAVARALANTYEGDRDGWARVEEHQEVMAYAAEHPDKGSSAVASALDLPRGRIRPWMEDGARPDPANAVLAAEELDWLDLSWTVPPFTALNVLVAWTFAGGAINKLLVPAFVVGDAERAVAERALATLGLEHRSHRDDEPGRATEILPAEHGTVLGRMLLALGAPQGEKNADADIALPPYLDRAPTATRLAFARTYVWLRAAETADRPNWPLVITEKRSPPFKRALQALLRDVVGDADAVSGSVDAPSTFLSPAAAELLDRPPSVSKRLSRTET